MRTVRCLSIHADYACRHSGACCTAGWRIPLEEGLRHALIEAGKQGRLALAGTLTTPLETAPCRFFLPASRLCAIHRDLGAKCKPSSCQQFPRVALLDARGVSLTLSHFCPTAASLLFREDVPLAIVESPAAFPATDDYEGLDARNVLPPLLRPRMLWDLDGYSAWEEQAVALFARPDLGPEHAVDHLRQVAERIESWNPGDGSLRAHVVRCFERAGGPRAGARVGGFRGDRDEARVVNRYLAARLFASWVPYRADRLGGLVDDLESTLASLTKEASRTDLLQAIRQTDLCVVHGV